MRVRHIVICGLPGFESFSILPHKPHDFRKKNLFIIKCVFWFSLQSFSGPFPIPRNNERDMIIKTYIGLHVKYPSFLFDFNETYFLDRFFEKYSNIKFHENPSSCSMRTDGWTDRHDEANSRFSHFCEGDLKTNKSTSIKCVLSRYWSPTRFDRFFDHHHPSSQCRCFPVYRWLFLSQETTAFRAEPVSSRFLTF